MKKQSTPLGTVIGAAFIEAMEENGDLVDTLRNVLEDPKIKEELRSLVRDYLNSDAGRSYIIDLMEQDYIFGEALDTCEAQNLLKAIVLKKLQA